METRPLRHVLTIAASSLLATGASAQLSPEASALLRRSIAAHSSEPAQLRLLYRGDIASPDQSAKSDGPPRPNTWTVRLAIDERAQAVAYDPDLVIDGDMHFRNPVGFADGRGFALSYTGRYFDTLTAFPSVADTYLPHRQLQNVLATARTGTVVSDSVHDRLVYTTASGESLTLVFDRLTHLLVAVRRSPSPTVYGDQTRETGYGPYRRIAGTMVPRVVSLRLRNAIHGSVERGEMRLVEATVGGPRESELRPPAHASLRKPDPRTFETVTLGRDVYLLRNAGTAGPISYNVLAVVFEDEVLVVEAALNDGTSRRVLSHVATLAPGKPIRRVVQTHHHGDHIGGIRTYIANGTTIIAPQGMRRLVDRIAVTHSALAPDTLAKAPTPARVEEVQRERVIRDARNEVRLYDVPSGHSEHMLVVYLPEQRVLFQGDLVNADEVPLNATSRQFLTWLRAQRIDVAALAGVHGRTLHASEVRALLAEGLLLGRASSLPLPDPVRFAPAR